MKICVVFNHESARVINLFGIANREKYGLGAIANIVAALRKGGHTVQSMEGDKDLISKLEDFMPRVLKGERPGMVFNLSYGIQGQARYTHVPSILEMVGIPYIGSGPQAHSLALDKVVSKMIFCQHDLPTPEFVVLKDPEFDPPKLRYPLIVKPKNEALSLGIVLVENEDELRVAAKGIFDDFGQPALVEEFIEGREINVGLIGNNPCETFMPAEMIFKGDGPTIYSLDDKRGKSGRKVSVICPAQIDDKIRSQACQLAQRAFSALGCCDCARVDMRLDSKGRLFLLEINSLPSLGPRGSYVAAAKHAGLDFDGLINRLVEVASTRYFGTPNPPVLKQTRQPVEDQIFKFLTERRDRITQRLKRWGQISSRTNDTIGIRNVVGEISKSLDSLKMSECEELTDGKWVWTWQSNAGLEGGTLLVLPVDIPMEENVPMQGFRREPEWFYGEGIGSSRGSFVMMQFALWALRRARQLHRKRIGIVLYADEGLNCMHSCNLISQASSHAARVLVLRPGHPNDGIVVDRRGERVYQLIVEGTSRRLDQTLKKSDPFRWVSERLIAFSQMGKDKRRLSISTVDVRTTAFPMKLPHRVTCKIIVTYSSTQTADQAYSQMQNALKSDEFTYELSMTSQRPPMVRRRINTELVEELEAIADQWEIPVSRHTSAWPSVAGLVDKSIPVVCGLGPVATDLYTPNERISRISLTQRTLLLAQFLGKTD